MPPTHQYQIISAPSGVPIQSLLAQNAAQGWKPILMSTAVTPNGVHVYIVVEKPIGS